MSWQSRSTRSGGATPKLLVADLARDGGAEELVADALAAAGQVDVLIQQRRGLPPNDGAQ